MSIEKRAYGSTSDGRAVDAYVITNKSGAYIQLLTYGATLDKIVVPDRDGKPADVLLGFDDMDGQENRHASQGRVVGRVANRITGNGLHIDGKDIPITKNVEGKITLHGAHEYAEANWAGEIVSDNAVRFSYVSPDGTHGFPGRVENTVIYTFTEDNAVQIDFYAVSDKKTVLNLTNHVYFNLGGYDAGSILGHELQIFADAYTPMGDLSVPTGEIRPVKGTPFDFNEMKTIGRDVNADDEQLRVGNGYDHNFRLLNYNGEVRRFAIAKDPVSGRVMECFTDLPGVQLYIGNFLCDVVGKGGKPMANRTGFCLETQYFPNACNNPHFVQNVFDAGEPFKSTTIFKFSAE